MVVTIHSEDIFPLCILKLRQFLDFLFVENSYTRVLTFLDSYKIQKQPGGKHIKSWILHM
jgi:hypothetical protein